MAKFCKYCGKPLAEGETCTCPKAVAEAQANAVNSQAQQQAAAAQAAVAAQAEAAQRAAQAQAAMAQQQYQQGQQQFQQGQQQFQQGQQQFQQGQQQFQQQPYPAQPAQPSQFSLACKEAWASAKIFFKDPVGVLTRAYQNVNKSAQFITGALWAILVFLTMALGSVPMLKGIVMTTAKKAMSSTGFGGGSSFSDVSSGWDTLAASSEFQLVKGIIMRYAMTIAFLIVLGKFVQVVVTYAMGRKVDQSHSFKDVLALFCIGTIPETACMILTFLMALLGAIPMVAIFATIGSALAAGTMFFEALLVCRDVRNRTYYVVVISNLAVTLISYLYAISVMGSMMNLTQMMR